VTRTDESTAEAPQREPEQGTGTLAGIDRSRLVRTLTDSTAVIALVLLVLIGVFSALRPDAFPSVNNLLNIAVAASTLLVLAVGATFVIVSKGIDLSVGSVLVFSGVVSVRLMEQVNDAQGWGAVAAGLAAAVVAGLAWGLLHGFLIAKAEIPPLIVTLGSFGAALGAAQLITGGVNLRTVPTEMVTVIGNGELFGVIPWLVIIALAVTLVASIALRKTRFGRYTYAIGSNAEAARRVGIDVDRHLLKVYTLQGALSGLAGFMSLARFSNTTIAGHTTDNLQAISAVVIGGTSLFGGIGTILGTLVGVLIPAVLQNGFVILRVQPFWQQVAVGIVLVAAVYVDQLKRKARESM
jgi:ribose transport system permease protein